MTERQTRQLGGYDENEYTDEEKEKIMRCRKEHSFYEEGKMKGALRYCSRCDFGYNV